MDAIESPGDLIGREVEFLWRRSDLKPVRVKGTVLRPGRAPGTVIIRSDTQNIPARRNYSRQKAWCERVRSSNALYCRPIGEIEVVA